MRMTPADEDMFLCDDAGLPPGNEAAPGISFLRAIALLRFHWTVHTEM
jgi:hypothetical protein